eukprot:scaffold6348_cov259-Pinguiococcus_pyrenoidosus.AAC.8
MVMRIRSGRPDAFSYSQAAVATSTGSMESTASLSSTSFGVVVVGQQLDEPVRKGVAMNEVHRLACQATPGAADVQILSSAGRNMAASVQGIVNVPHDQSGVKDALATLQAQRPRDVGVAQQEVPRIVNVGGEEGYVLAERRAQAPQLVQQNFDRLGVRAKRGDLLEVQEAQAPGFAVDDAFAVLLSAHFVLLRQVRADAQHHRADDIVHGRHDAVRVVPLHEAQELVVVDDAVHRLHVEAVHQRLVVLVGDEDVQRLHRLAELGERDGLVVVLVEEAEPFLHGRVGARGRLAEGATVLGFLAAALLVARQRRDVAHRQQSREDQHLGLAAAGLGRDASRRMLGHRLQLGCHFHCGECVAAQGSGLGHLERCVAAGAAARGVSVATGVALGTLDGRVRMAEHTGAAVCDTILHRIDLALSCLADDHRAHDQVLNEPRGEGRHCRRLVDLPHQGAAVPRPELHAGVGSGGAEPLDFRNFQRHRIEARFAVLRVLREPQPHLLRKARAAAVLLALILRTDAPGVDADRGPSRARLDAPKQGIALHLDANESVEWAMAGLRQGSVAK